MKRGSVWCTRSRGVNERKEKGVKMGTRRREEEMSYVSTME